MRDHDLQTVKEFRGLFDRGDDEVVPANYFISTQNLKFTQRGFQTRDGSVSTLTLADIRRMKIYRISGQAQRLLILDKNGNLYDSTNLVTPIMTIGAMTDFSVATMFDRAFISPHDGTTGLAGQSVNIYTGSGLARAAAGAAPTGFTLTAADSGVSGKVETGIKVLGVCYITNTGYVTAPGGFVSFNPLGGRKLDMSILPVGGTNIVARIMVCTKTIINFDGNFAIQTYYFVPNGTINDNVSTTVTLDFYDSDLEDDASYTLDQLASIPAGVCIRNYNGRLVVGGENLNPSTGRVSKSGEPESFDATEGFFTANPGDAGTGIKNIFPAGDRLIINKSQRTYFTLDTGDNAVFWQVKELDMSVGSECHAVGEILDYGETMEDIALVADRKGLRVFNGTFAPQPLSWPIEDLWKRINKAAFKTVEVVVDPVSTLIYVAVPLDSATSPSHVLVCDYNDGLDGTKVKWVPWVFPVAPVSIVVDLDNTTKQSIFKYAGYTGNIYKTSSSNADDFSNAIDQWAEFPFFPHETNVKAPPGIYHFGGINVRVRGTGNLQVSMRNQDSSITATAVAIALAASPGIDKFRQFNFQSQRCAVKLRMTNDADQMIISRFQLLTKWLWSEVPA